MERALSTSPPRALRRCAQPHHDQPRLRPPQHAALRYRIPDVSRDAPPPASRKSKKWTPLRPFPRVPGRRKSLPRTRSSQKIFENSLRLLPHHCGAPISLPPRTGEAACCLAGISRFFAHTISPTPAITDPILATCALLMPK